MIDLTPDLTDLTPGPNQCWECPIHDGQLVCDPQVSLRCPNGPVPTTPATHDADRTARPEEEAR